MGFVADLFWGRQGLAKTYWLWGVVGGILVGLGQVVAIYVSTRFFVDDLIYDVLVDGYSLFLILWSLFISIAIINAAKYNRDRGFWGWIATLLSVVGIINALRIAAILVGILSLSWRDLEKSIRFENLGLPIEVAEGLTLTKMSADRASRATTYHMDINIPSWTDMPLDIEGERAAMLAGCADLADFLGGPVEVAIWEFTANDGTVRSVSLVPEDCGF